MRSLKWKIRNMHSLCIYYNKTSWKFQNIWTKTVSTVQSWNLKVVPGWTFVSPSFLTLIPKANSAGTYPGFRPGGGHLLSKGPPGYPRPPWRLGAQETRGPWMTAEAHWVIRDPSGNQGYMNETLIYIFLPSKRFIHCLEEKNIMGPEGPLRALREGQ